MTGKTLMTRLLALLAALITTTSASMSWASWRYDPTQNRYTLVAEPVTIVELSSATHPAGFRLFVDAPLQLAPPDATCRFPADGKIPIVTHSSTVTLQLKLLFTLAATAMASGKRVRVTGYCDSTFIYLSGLALLDD
jgi:hypothetical protein